MSEYDWEKPLPPALEEYVRQRAAEDFIADTDRHGHVYLNRDVVLVASTDTNKDFAQYLPPSNDPAPYYLVSVFDDEPPQAIHGPQDKTLLAAVDIEAEWTQRFAMFHHCKTLAEAQTLMECGADLDQLNEFGETALLSFLQPFYSGEPEAQKIALYLIDQGANISIGSTDRGQHAIHLATTPQVLDALLERGASINQIDDLGQTQLHDLYGAAHAQLLLDRGADPNALDQDGNTPLHYAPDRDTAVLLLERGADPAIQNKDGQTAEQYQSAEGDQGVADYLRSTRLRNALGQTASQSRPQDSDLASPDEYLARRNRGRAL